MDVEECERIVRTVQSLLPKNLTIQCLRWDGDPKTRTARGYFTADPLVKIGIDDNGDGDGATAGSQPPPSGSIVLIPERVFGGEKEIRELLAHELVHAYDHCELRRDLTLCEELACSEVRAAREAECAGFDTALLKGAFCRSLGSETEYCQLVKRACVERIAIRSTRSVFSEQQASDCVKAAFDRCYSDVRGPLRAAINRQMSASASLREANREKSTEMG